jgi:tetratricopeptide (TPR) repeat protein
MLSLSCPQCTKPIADDGRCAKCGLDATLVVQIRRAAERAARNAARAAAAGSWQEAYDIAAGSLRLARRDNDLAAFVLLAAALAGAQGYVATVARPRADALPESVAPLVDGVLACADRLRTLAATSASSSEIEDTLRDLDVQHPLLPPPPPPPAVAPPPPRPLWPRLATAAGMALVVGVAAGWWNGERTTRNLFETQIAATATQSKAPGQVAVAAAAPPPVEPWVKALHELPPGASAALRDDLRSRAWRRGRDASRNGRYEEARQFLELAVQGPSRSWYWPHAVYYLGKSYHRLGRKEDAAATYRRLERDAPSSDYVPEARRLLARIAKGQGVDR